MPSSPSPASLRSLLSCLLLLVSATVWMTSPATVPAVAAASPSSPSSPDEAADHPVDPALLGSLSWRDVGPLRGGRVAAVAGIPGDASDDARQTYYFGATGGGVWKTTDGGHTWNPISDGHFGGSIGAVAVSAWDPNVLYVGGGEKTVRGNVSHGDGVWKSTDAGKTWSHVGLGDTRHVPRIRIHPRDPDTAWVCALGHLFGPNDERGVFRTSDGGTSWEKVLFVNENAGCVDLALDPTNPRILYSTFWRVRRTPYSLESGGEGSSMWKSTDGGTTWDEITESEGLPDGTLGIMGIDVSPTNPDNLYAIVEAEDGGVFRSRDAGATWTRTTDVRDLRQRAWYYTRIYADPADEESVYVLNVGFHHSKDGGKTFRRIPVPHGDNHDLWIDPDDPRRMIQSNDGGANVSFDGGATWSTQTNQPTAQMYRVSTDDDFPYRILGGQQDNSSVRMRHRSFTGGPIDVREWESSAGCECGHIVAKPDDPDVVIGGCYGGQMERVNHRTGESRTIDVWPDDPMGWGAADLRYRFQWNYPIFFSPHDPDRLYAAAQVLFRSDDLGESWTAISPDLSRSDESKMGPSGGPITKDNTSVEYYGTIFAALESPHEKDVLWAGTDDGRLHLSRDGGEAWTETTPRQMPEWAMINSLEAHPGEPGGLYVAATLYKSDDFRPYLYKTTDYGETWTEITDGIADDHFTRVVRADPDRPGLLYAGTERGVYVSFDDGARWQPLQLNLPVVPVTDLAVKEGDLVAATQGRGFWILDDLSPLHELDATRADRTQLFTPRETLRLASFAGFGHLGQRTTGANAPTGALIHYYLPQREDDGSEEEAEEKAEEDEPEIRLEILDAEGEVIRTFTPKKDDEEGTDEPTIVGEMDDDVLDVSPGAHRLLWDLRHPGPVGFPGMVIWNRFLAGPTAVPGTYTARLQVGDERHEATFELVADPRIAASREDLQAQFDFLRAVGAKLTETHREIGRIRDVRGQLEALEERIEVGEENDAETKVLEKAEALDEALRRVEEALYQTKNESPQDPLNFPIRLNDKLANLYSSALQGDFRPTESMGAVRRELEAKIDAHLDTLERIWRDDLPAFDALVRESGIAAVHLPPLGEEKEDGENDRKIEESRRAGDS